MGNSDFPGSRIYSFDGFVLDAVRRTLHRDGIEVELRAKCFDLLTCLVRNAGRTVTKDELIDTIWAGVVVTDESLARCVSDIRQVLGDRDQRIVKTVPRRGYFLATPVSTPQSEPVAINAATGAVAPASGEGRADPPTSPARNVVGRAWLLGSGFAALLALVAGFAWLRPVAPANSAPALSIIVLPLANLSGDPAQNDFVQGLTEDLSTDLSRIPESFVIARGTADTYKGRTVDARQVGREVGVRYVMEGSVRRLGDTVRLNLRLVDVENGRELWADRMDGSRDGLADMQSGITGTIARALHVEMVEAESQRSRRLRPLDPDAQDLLWQARGALERRTPESTALARDLLLRAAAMDPSSASVWGVLSETYAADLMARWMNLRGASIDEWVRRAGEAADKAHAIDPNNLDAIFAMGRAMQARGRPGEALEFFRRLVEINRNHAPGWSAMSYAYATLGKSDAAIAAGEQALRLSPRDRRVNSSQVIIAAAHLLAGRDEEALLWAKRSVASRPEHGIAHAWVAAAAANLGDMATASAAMAEFKRRLPGYTLATFRAEAHGDNPEFLVQRERFYQGLQKAGLTE